MKPKTKPPEVNTSQPGRFVSKVDALAHAEKFVAERYREEKSKNPAAYYEKLGVLTAFALDLVDPQVPVTANVGEMSIWPSVLSMGAARGR